MSFKQIKLTKLKKKHLQALQKKPNENHHERPKNKKKFLEKVKENSFY